MHKATLERLIKELTHSDPSGRRCAAEALSEGDERAVFPLLKALHDSNLGVQDAAIKSLMRMKNETTAYMVIPLLREDVFLRNTALIILREMGTIAIPLIRALLNDKDDDVRKFAIDLIYDINYCDYPDKLLEILMNDPNANVRASAAKTLGKLNLKEAVPYLIKALNDEEWVCFSALEALTVLKDNSAIAPILALSASPSEAIRLAMLETLGKIGSQDIQKFLAEHVSKSSGLEKRAAIISLVQLGMIPPSMDIFDELIDMLITSDWDDKYVAIKGLLILRDERAIYHMIDVAGSIDYSAPDRHEKIQFIREAVSSFGCNRYLCSILDDNTMRYRGKSLAIEIAGDLKCHSVVDSLIKLIKSNSRDIRRSSVESLGKIDSGKARDYLFEAIRDHDSHVRKSAVIALGKICEMSAFEPLMKLLNKEVYYDVIDEIIKSLLQINATLFLSRIGELNDQIRKVAARHAPLCNPESSC
ncbi:MAG: hypothetical protein C4538_08390 [Nitrospiraceae bacterium]|nr:MAG: hypothetical protein C4538_08390 [Nitrospiraceae bacterium]